MGGFCSRTPPTGLPSNISTICSLVPTQAVQLFVEAVGSADMSLLEYQGEAGVCLQHVGPLLGKRTRVLLTDPALTAFYFVTLPEALPIAVVTRFIQWFKDFGIPVGGVLVNMVIDPASVGPDTAEFVKNRVATQQEHMRTIWRECGGSVRAIVPLFETEVRGVPMLRRLCDAIYAADGAKPAPDDGAGRPVLSKIPTEAAQAAIR